MQFRNEYTKWQTLSNCLLIIQQQFEKNKPSRKKDLIVIEFIIMYDFLHFDNQIRLFLLQFSF